VHLLSESDRVLEASLALTSLTLAYTELISGALTEGYTDRQRKLILEVDHDRRDVLERILQGTFDRQSDTARLASEFALVSGADHLVVVLNAGPSASPQPSGEALNRAADTLKRHFVFAVAQPFVVLRHVEIVSIAPLSRARASTLAHLTHQALAELRQSGADWYAGLSTVCAGLGEVGRGYQEARLAADMAITSEGGVCALLEVRVSDYLMARADETALRMIPPRARQVLQSAHADDRLLVETLIAHARADFSVAMTAEALAVHPNTVSYRLRKLSQRLDRDLSRFSDTTEVLAWIRTLEQLDARA
jgi:sugar diacid utilization regulator